MRKLNDKKLAKRLAKKGKGKDTILAHINPQEAAMLKMMGGSGTINPKTGLVQFDSNVDDLGVMLLPAALPPPDPNAHPLDSLYQQASDLGFAEKAGFGDYKTNTETANRLSEWYTAAAPQASTTAEGDNGAVGTYGPWNPYISNPKTGFSYDVKSVERIGENSKRINRWNDAMSNVSEINTGGGSIGNVANFMGIAVPAALSIMTAGAAMPALGLTAGAAATAGVGGTLGLAKSGGDWDTAWKSALISGATAYAGGLLSGVGDGAGGLSDADWTSIAAADIGEGTFGAAGVGANAMDGFTAAELGLMNSDVSFGGEGVMGAGGSGANDYWSQVGDLVAGGASADEAMTYLRGDNPLVYGSQEMISKGADLGLGPNNTMSLNDRSLGGISANELAGVPTTPTTPKSPGSDFMKNLGVRVGIPTFLNWALNGGKGSGGGSGGGPGSGPGNGAIPGPGYMNDLKLRAGEQIAALGGHKLSYLNT